MNDCNVHGKVAFFPCEQCFGVIDGDLTTTDNKAPREKALHLAAQCWCDDETSNIEMDSRLAMAFAKRYDKLQSRLEKCEETLKLIRGYAYAMGEGNIIAERINEYFAEVEK